MDYLKFFDINSEPFQNDLDARFYFESAPQRQARMRVLRGIQQKKALTVVYGGPGRGKTTLAHNLLRNLMEGDYAVRFLSIPHEGCASGWFLPNVARQYGVKQLAPTIPGLADQVHARMREVRDAGKHPVLFVDEAQLFRNANAMEEFRGLLNLLHEGERLVSMVLFGLYELGEIIKLDPPLAQRVDIRVELKPMDRDESRRYLEHRMKLAGGSMSIFTSDAIDALFAFSGGVPRVINTLADNTLFDAMLCEANPADGSLVAGAAEALGLSVANAASAPSGLELDLGLGQALPDISMHRMAPLGESTSGAAEWVEPAAPMPDSLPSAETRSERFEARPAPQRVGPVVDPAVLEEAAASLELIRTPKSDKCAPELSPVDDDFPPLNREFVTPVSAPAAAGPAPATVPEESSWPTLDAAFDAVMPAPAAEHELPSVEAEDTMPGLDAELEFQIDKPSREIQASKTAVVGPSLPFSDDDSTPISLHNVITPEKQAELREQLAAKRPPAAPTPAPQPAKPAAPSQPAAEFFNLGSILDEDDGGPASSPMLSLPLEEATDASIELDEIEFDVQEEIVARPASPPAAPTRMPRPQSAAAAAAKPAAARPAKPAGPRIEIPEGEDDDLDSLFESIQLGD